MSLPERNIPSWLNARKSIEAEINFVRVVSSNDNVDKNFYLGQFPPLSCLLQIYLELKCCHGEWMRNNGTHYQNFFECLQYMKYFDCESFCELY